MRQVQDERAEKQIMKLIKSWVGDDNHHSAIAGQKDSQTIISDELLSL